MVLVDPISGLEICNLHLSANLLYTYGLQCVLRAHAFSMTLLHMMTVTSVDTHEVRLIYGRC